MNFTKRVGLAAALLGTFGGAIAFLSSGGANETAHQGPTRWESSKQCEQCHQDVFAEWQASHHKITYTNPEVRELSEDFRKEECKDCHLPRPLAITGFGNRTLPRTTLFDEGVSCVSCHLGPDGGIVARNDRPEVPCKPKRDESFLAVVACKSCHNQHQTTDQWEQSRYARLDITCASCHMPEVERKRTDKSSRMGRGHVFLGCHDTDTLKKAYTFTAVREAGELVMAVTNVGAGHNFPTEERHRAVDMMYRFVTRDAAAGDWVLAHRARQPYRDSPDPVGPGAGVGENTQLPAGATKTVRIAIPAGPTAVEVRLWYRLTPFCKDDDPRSTLLEERRIELP